MMDARDTLALSKHERLRDQALERALWHESEWKAGHRHQWWERVSQRMVDHWMMMESCLELAARWEERIQLILDGTFFQ